jgi:fructuronate reductase
VRLSAASLGRLAPAVERFQYDRAKQAVGIVHFGIGAFHRAHQAWYTDRAMDAGDRDWAISGVSFRRRDVAAQLNPQSGLFAVAERGDSGMCLRVVGAVRNAIHSASAPHQAAGLLASRSTRIVSLTVTEKGYCRSGAGALDQAAACEAKSFYPTLIEGLRRRCQAKLGGLTVLSCDNLAGNGAQLARLVNEYCDRFDPVLGRWIEADCSFPSTMVDRIVPATTPADIVAIERDLRLRDEAAVVTEPFSQWVIEDRFVAGRPSGDKVGAELVSDVAPYETAKLRMLNGAHSALAYLGLRQRHRFVHEAVGDANIRPLIERLMRQEAAASFVPAPEQNLSAYADALLERFANPALNHRLSQIAMDGSQKIPQRWLETLAWHQGRGQQCPAILSAIAAWLRHIRGDNGPVDDPLAASLSDAWARAGEAGILETLFGEGGLLASSWRPTLQDRDFTTQRIAESLHAR